MFKFIFRFSCKKLVKYCMILLIFSYLVNSVNGFFSTPKTISSSDNQTIVEKNLKSSRPENIKHESINKKLTQDMDEFYRTKTNEDSPYYKEDGTNPIRQGALHEEAVDASSEHPGSAWIDKEGKDIVQRGIDCENSKPKNEKPFINSDNVSSEDYKDNEYFK